MGDDLTYIKNLKVNELIDIVSNIWGFEETSEDLIQLEKEDPETVISSLKKRKEKLGKVLLYDVLKELNSGFYLNDIRDLPETVINRIINDYDDLPKNLVDELRYSVILSAQLCRVITLVWKAARQRL